MPNFTGCSQSCVSREMYSCKCLGKKRKKPQVGTEVLTLREGTWVAQSVERPTLARAMISHFVGSSPTLGEPHFSLSLSAPCGILSPAPALPHLHPPPQKKNV